MLPRKNRIREEFLKKQGRQYKQISSGPVSLRIYNGGSLPPKFTVIVTSATAKKATRRNLLKRKARVIIKEFIPDIKKGGHFAIVLGGKSINADYQEVKTAVEEVLKKGNLL